MNTVNESLTDFEYTKQFPQNSGFVVFTIDKKEEEIFESLISESALDPDKKERLMRILAAKNNTIKSEEFFSSGKTFVILVNRNATQKEESSILSEREKEVLSELSLGKRYKQIAESLFISVHTVKFHMKSIYRKFNIHSQSEAVTIAAKIGLI